MVREYGRVFFAHEPRSQRLSNVRGGVRMSLLFSFCNRLLGPSNGGTVSLCCGRSLSLTRITSRAKVAERNIHSDVGHDRRRLFRFRRGLNLFGRFDGLRRKLSRVSTLTLRVGRLSRSARVARLTSIVVRGSNSLGSWEDFRNV